jgi:hypothetical protein
MMNDDGYDHDVDGTDLIRTDRLWFDVSRCVCCVSIMDTDVVVAVSMCSCVCRYMLAEHT